MGLIAPTQREPTMPNKLGITPGPWKYEGGMECEKTKKDFGNILGKNNAPVADAVYADDALLIVEAGTVANETGLTPRQLQEQRDELLSLLVKGAELSQSNQRAMSQRNALFAWGEMVEAAISRATGK